MSFVNLKLLYIEDNDDRRETILNMIRPLFKEVVSTSSSKEAISLIKEDHDKSIDIILTPINTNSSETFDMLDEIRLVRKNILAILKTPLAYNKIFEYISKIDKNNDYISQPFDLIEFKKCVKNNVKKHKVFKKQESYEMLLYQYKHALNEVSQTITFDDNGIITNVNKYFCRVFKTDKKTILNQNINDFFIANNSDNLLEEVFDEIEFKSTYTDILSSKLSDGSIIYGDISIMPIYHIDKNLKSYLLLRQDVTKLRHEMISAREAEKAKDTFLANMSHEVRTPLNAIIGYANLLEVMDIDEKAKDKVSIIKKSSNHLLDIINEILDLSKIKSGNLSLKPQWFNIIDEINNIKNIFVNSAKDRNLNFESIVDKNFPTEVYTDSTRLKQVVVNLLANAIKFASNNVWVTYNVVKIKDEKVNIEVVVRDDGNGIAKSKQEKIFSPFKQENDAYTTLQYGGTGLGLSVVTEILMMLDTKIELKSDLGLGSTFSFKLTLPYRNSTNSSKKPISKQQYKQYGATVLVVEDNIINQDLIKDTLSLYGVQVAIANNGQEAVDFYKDNNNINMIFMDINMPVMGGIEATQEILSYENISRITHTPIIALTSNSIAGDKQKCLEAGMDGYLSKPFQISALENILEHFLTSNYSKKLKLNTELDIPIEKIKEYIHRFKRDLKKDIPKMKKCINEKKYIRLASLSHKYKGTAGLLGIRTFEEKLRDIEANAIDKNEYDYLSLVHALELSL